MLARGAFLLGALLSALSSSDGLGVPSAPVLQRLGAMKEKRAAFVPGLRTSLPAVARSGASICDERAEVRRASPALRGTIAWGMQFGKESGKSAVLDKPVVAPAPGDVQQKDPEKPYHVLLFNDVSPLTPLRSTDLFVLCVWGAPGFPFLACTYQDTETFPKRPVFM